MNKETFEKLMDKRQIEHENLYFGYMMKLSENEDDLKSAELFSRFKHMRSRTEFALYYAVRKAKEVRDFEMDDIRLGYRRLTADGRLEHVPTPEEIKSVDDMMNKLGL